MLMEASLCLIRLDYPLYNQAFEMMSSSCLCLNHLDYLLHNQALKMIISSDLSLNHSGYLPHNQALITTPSLDQSFIPKPPINWVNNPVWSGHQPFNLFLHLQILMVSLLYNPCLFIHFSEPRDVYWIQDFHLLLEYLDTRQGLVVLNISFDHLLQAFFWRGLRVFSYISHGM